MFKFSLYRSIPFSFLMLVSTFGFAENNKPSIDSIYLNLPNFIEQVLEKNPKLSQMKMAYQSIQTQIIQKSAYPDPMISYSLAPQSLFNTTSEYAQIISASQQIPWLGKQELKADIAKWQATANQENITTTRLSLIAASKTIYAQWQFIYAAIKINNQNKILLEEFKNIAEIKYSAGRASKQDVLRAEVEIALLSLKDETLTRRKTIISAQINTLLNREPNLPVLAPSLLTNYNKKIDIKQLQKIVLKHHPQLKQISASIVAAEKQQRLAKQNLLPDFKLSASYNSLRMNNDNRFTIGVGINIPLREKRQSAIDEASLNGMTLGWNKQALVAEIKNRLQQLYAQFTESQRIIHLYKSRLLPLADENLQAARSDYESGQGNFLDMITAEQNLINVQLQLEQTRADYQQRYARLEELSGGESL